MAIDQHDDESVRCPRLGDSVPFKFCRTSGGPMCWMIVSCWAVRLDIGQYLADHFSAEVLAEGLRRPEGGRVGRMLEISEKYRP